MNLWVLIGLPIGGFIFAVIACAVYLKYCDEWSARQFIKDFYNEGVKPAPAKMREVWDRARGRDVPRRVQIHLGHRRKAKVRKWYEVPDGLNLPERIQWWRWLNSRRSRPEKSLENESPVIPQRRTAGISRVKTISSPTDSYVVDLSKRVPNTSSYEKQVSKAPPIPEPRKPSDEFVEWPYRVAD